MSMTAQEYVATTEGTTQRGIKDIQTSLGEVDAQHGHVDCSAYPHVARAVRSNGYGVIAALENQVTFAKYVTNGGLQTAGWKIGLGPFKASGRSIFEFVILVSVMAVVIIHFRTVKQGQQRIRAEVESVAQDVIDVLP